MSRLPAIRDDTLSITPGEIHAQVETAAWFAWLATASSFTYVGVGGTFTARHEERAGSRFWYAYRRKAGKLHKTYLGRAAELTLRRLEEAAQALARAGETQPEGASMIANALPLVMTKIAMPQPGMFPIARPAVVARCLEGSEHPVTLIAAPAGFGKTTLLLMTCEQLTARGRQIAWVALEETERDPVRFWTYVLAALDGAQPGGGGSAQRLLQTPRPPSIETILTALVNALAAAPTPLALVLDDYHRAATPAIDQSMVFLIEHAPPMLRLLIATRSEPGFLLPRLRAQGRVAELHAADLRFSAAEATRFLRETMHVTLSAEQSARLAAQTEGWVAGLQLAALALRDQTTSRDLPATTAAPTRYVAEYLIGEVVEQQPVDVQAFLRQTAMLDRLTGPLCDAVTGRTDSAAMLTRLVQTQLFVTPLDANQTWFRYHHLFAEIVRVQFEQEEPASVAQCHRRAAHWWQQQGMVDDAIRHLCAAQDFDEAAALIETEADRLVMRGETASLVTWAEALPRAVILAHPHLCVLGVFAWLLQGEGAKANTWLDDLERHMVTLAAASAAIAGEIAAVRAILLLIAGDMVGCVRCAQVAMQQLGAENHLLRGLALWLTSIAGMLGIAADENLAETQRVIGAIADASLRDGNLLVAFFALATKAGVELYQGRLHRAAQTCRDALRLLPVASGQEPPLAAMAYSILGEIQREWNDLAGAESYLHHALEISQYLGNSEFVNDAYIALAMVQAAHGKYDEALTTFEDLRHLIRTQQLATWDLDQMEVMRVRVLIAHGQLAEAARWAAAYQHSHQEGSFAALGLGREISDLACARVVLAQGGASVVIPTLTDLVTRATAGGRLRHVLEARMLLARAHWLTDGAEAAMRDLDAALALAAPEGFMRVFLDEGESLADPLAVYVAARQPSPERAHALKLLKAFGRNADIAAPLTSLSPRERDVLRLLALGRSNAAMATELVVALSTVKWHIAQIYRKLGVSGRVQAITRARELHIIA